MKRFFGSASFFQGMGKGAEKQTLFKIIVDISTQIVYYSFCRQTTMREWLSGGAPPCQGGGRGFDPRLALLFLRRRQAKVPDSCLHEMKALWRPPDIEHEMRDGGGDAGWVVLRLAAYYPLFLGTGIDSARGFGLRSAPVGAKRTSTGRPAPRLALFFCVGDKPRCLIRACTR